MMVQKKRKPFVKPITRKQPTVDHVTGDKIPKSFVFCRGKLPGALRQLEMDLRKLMLPFTALKLKVHFIFLIFAFFYSFNYVLSNIKLSVGFRKILFLIIDKMTFFYNRCWNEHCLGLIILVWIDNLSWNERCLELIILVEMRHCLELRPSVLFYMVSIFSFLNFYVFVGEKAQQSQGLLECSRADGCYTFPHLIENSNCAVLEGC